MDPQDAQRQDHPYVIRTFVRNQIKDLFGLEDTTGFEIFGLVRALNHIYDSAENRGAESPDLSGPRWRLLALLLHHEQLGKKKGLTPTALSHMRGVSKNTISSLLRGLEEQGYIRRELDPEDRRVFRIRLTDAGLAVAKSLAPAQAAYISRLASDLSAGEREQLISLLGKLFRSVLNNSGLHAPPTP